MRQRCGSVQDQPRQSVLLGDRRVGMNRVPDARALGVDMGRPGRNRHRNFRFCSGCCIERFQWGRQVGDRDVLPLDVNPPKERSVPGRTDRLAGGVSGIKTDGLVGPGLRCSTPATVACVVSFSPARIRR